jgi:hypothetical protein
MRGAYVHAEEREHLLPLDPELYRLVGVLSALPD